MIRQKIEIRFQKGDAIRFISHHDLMRAFQRAVRRAGLPVRLTAGFNPRPRIVFPVALEVGIASLDEAVEIELTEWIPLDDLRNRLTSQLPPNLPLTAIRELPPTRRGSRPTQMRYRLHLAKAGLTIAPNRLNEMLAQPALPFLRDRPQKGKARKPETIDLKPFLVAAALAEDGDLVVDLQPHRQATARPLELLSLLTGEPVVALKRVPVTKLRMTLEPPPTPPTTPTQAN